MQDLVKGRGLEAYKERVNGNKVINGKGENGLKGRSRHAGRQAEL